MFDSLVGCESFAVDLETLTIIAGAPTRGALCKVLVNVTPALATVHTPSAAGIGKPPTRRFRWTMQQQRRPLWLGAWLIYELHAMDHAIELFGRRWTLWLYDSGSAARTRTSPLQAAPHPHQALW